MCLAFTAAARERLHILMFSILECVLSTEGVLFLQKGSLTVDCVWRLQLQRVGFFVVDLDSTAKKPVFNRTVPLK